MTFDEVMTDYGRAIRRCLSRYFARFDVPEHDYEEYETNAISKVWESISDGRDVNAAYVWRAVYNSCVDTYREMRRSRNGVQINLFSEESNFSEEFNSNYATESVYIINGDAFPNLPELAELDGNDLAVIREFMNLPVEDRSRRTILRRRVDSLLRRKLGIKSTNVRQYTSRSRH